MKDEICRTSAHRWLMHIKKSRIVGWVEDYDFLRSKKRNPQPTLINSAGLGLQPRPAKKIE
ncbi:MAG: hypothetical protein DRI57_00735 [Deltaproteobacteria bacterium]|nr:MAG: hypothetical protein DRI57_00735 [Deltaproteobacteria bacterium]